MNVCFLHLHFEGRGNVCNQVMSTNNRKSFEVIGQYLLLAFKQKVTLLQLLWNSGIGQFAGVEHTSATVRLAKDCSSEVEFASKLTIRSVRVNVSF